jgi:hypothetical protein
MRQAALWGPPTMQQRSSAATFDASRDRGEAISVPASAFPAWPPTSSGGGRSVLTQRTLWSLPAVRPT